MSVVSNGSARSTREIGVGFGARSGDGADHASGPGPAQPGGGLSATGGIARASDPDRFFATLFAPAAGREALWALIAFNHETVRAVEIARASRGENGVFAGLIRLQWWRDLIEGRADPGHHEIATPLAALVAPQGAIEPALLDAMLRSREQELEGPWRLSDVERMMTGGPGALAVAMGQALGVPPSLAGRIEAVGRAYGIGAMLRHREALARSGRRLWPDDVPQGDLAPLLALGRGALDEADVPGLAQVLTRRVRAAILLATLARRDLDRAGWPEIRRPVARFAGDRLAVLGRFLF